MIQKARENCGRVKMRITHEVYRSVHAHQGHCVEVSDDSVVFDRLVTHLHLVLANIHYSFAKVSSNPIRKNTDGDPVTGNMKQLIFVYNADSGVLSQIKDILVKVFSPKRYACNLCMVTYGLVRMKRAWKVFLEAVPRNIRFLHRNEFRDRYGEDSGLPAAFTVENGKLVPFLTAQEINGVDSLDELIGLVKGKLTDEK